jgi:hypothetical protein
MSRDARAGTRYRAQQSRAARLVDGGRVSYLYPMTIGSMARRGLALLLLFTATGAGPAPTLPLPPVLPEHPRTDQTAPRPNPDVRGPRDAASIGTQVQVTDFRASRQNQSLGYSPGSQFQTGEDRRSIQTPGLTVRVPLW